MTNILQAQSGVQPTSMGAEILESKNLHFDYAP